MAVMTLEGATALLPGGQQLAGHADRGLEIDAQRAADLVLGKAFQAALKAKAAAKREKKNATENAMTDLSKQDLRAREHFPCLLCLH